MDNNIINTVRHGERVTSTYADIYFDDYFCDNKILTQTNDPVKATTTNNDVDQVWVSPSDLLIDIIELKPPFTSKITRGKTHEGILAIGNEVLTNERRQFEKRLAALLQDNDAAWNNIMQYETDKVEQKVKTKYKNIFMEKSQIMTREISTFFEKSLQELEMHLKAEVNPVLISSHAGIVSTLNTDIRDKLLKQRTTLEQTLQKRYESEVAKIKKYYKLLLNNELYRNSSLINKAITERNDALKAFYRQIEAENVTSTMYIMCIERKKCRIKQFLTENIQTLEVAEKLQKIKEREDVINMLRDRDVCVSQINKEWEDKIKKVLQMFLKFISFSLKLLPEQSSFLLDFEKMVVIQLNEIQKMPNKVSSILFDENKLQNIFKFQRIGETHKECSVEPFIIEGDLSDPIPIQYGSRETLPSDVDLPTVRLQRQFVYAKCHTFEEIKAILEKERCKCSDILPVQPCASISNTSTQLKPEPSGSIKSESSYEPLLIDDISRLNECPVRNCTDWVKRLTFPHLESYLDYNEVNYERVKTVLGKMPKRVDAPEFIDPKLIAYSELPFSATKEPYHTVGTQYSSQEDLNVSNTECPCVDKIKSLQQNEEDLRARESPSKNINDVLYKRKISLTRMLQQNPKLLEMFTDESFDFQF